MIWVTTIKLWDIQHSEISIISMLFDKVGTKPLRGIIFGMFISKHSFHLSQGPLFLFLTVTIILSE